jgi:hypothetical protein
LEAHTELFSESNFSLPKKYERFSIANDTMILSAYYVHEALKGEAGFWWPFLQMLNHTDLPIFWETVEEFKNKIVI